MQVTIDSAALTNITCRQIQSSSKRSEDFDSRVRPQRQHSTLNASNHIHSRLMFDRRWDHVCVELFDLLVQSVNGS